MIQVYGPMMVGTHQGKLDIRDMGKVLYIIL